MAEPTPLDPFAPVGGPVAEHPEVHDRLRRAGPVVRVPAPAGGSVWIVTDHPIARAVLADPTFAKDPALAPTDWPGREPGLEPPASTVRSLTTTDGPQHRALRRVHAPLFTRRQIGSRRARMAEIARELLSGLAERSAAAGRPVDLVAEFLPHYPLLVVCDLLGIALPGVARAADAAAMTRGDAEHAHGGLAELQSLVERALAGADRTDSEVMRFAARARRELPDLRDDEIAYQLTGLVFAGQITTESFLGFLVAHHLADRAADRAGDGNGRDAALVAELLRIHPPAPFTLWRFTTAPVVLAGHHLPAGAPVLVDIEGIGTDPARFPDPHTADPHRPSAPDLAFGDGPHACVGAGLAQAEAQVLVEVLRSAFPQARLAVPFAQLRRDGTTARARRLAALPVWLDEPLAPR
ncbi:cytochrome P450 [Pseudonocardia humida]|uniref:Cytochrome P450 n=1 Tax=Pseudonocardia humida TaxID=2800819 RepID=A0ABT1A5R9_9PSEU|nr:cytochrome P450 [Pseudonocardia humida]MCO1658358.1 cytochrome P450 [Pseudonocardia humida]